MRIGVMVAPGRNLTIFLRFLGGKKWRNLKLEAREALECFKQYLKGPSRSREG